MTEAFNRAITSDNQEIGVVVKLLFSTPIYITSHQITGISGTVFQSALIPKTSISQTLNPDDSRSEIGEIKFDVLDTGITGELKSRLDSSEGIKRTVVEVYRGGRSDDFADFAKVQTQIVENQISIKDGRYSISCADIQRTMKKEIFIPRKTSITATVTTSSSTISVVNTAEFEPCPHTTSFGDGPGQTLYYLKLKKGDDFEIVSATDKTSTSFTGITRGLFFTDPFEFAYDPDEDAENQIQVIEYVYLEMPVPAMAYALLTGQIINGGTLPSNWHLGIDPSWVDIDQFQNTGEDWFNPSDYTKGLIYRFDGIGKTEGKRFIENELLKLIAFMPINGEGKLGFKRIARIIENTDYRYELNPSNIVKHSELKYNLSKTFNVIDLRWGYVEVPRQTKGFTRQDVLYDSPSVIAHKGEYLKSVSFRGIHNARHTRTTLTNLFNAFRDRYSNPPFEMNLTLLPTVYDLQVGDTVKINLPNTKDPVTDAPLNRTFEVQKVSTDLITGRVKIQVFASSGEASILTDDDAGGSSELPDGWYPTQGTDASTVLTIDGSGFLTADGTLTGADTSRTWFYYLGDLTIPSGRTLTIDDNVGLAVRGHLQIDGTIRAKSITSGSNFVGRTIGGGGYFIGGPSNGAASGDQKIGYNDTMPALTVENEAGALSGMPNDMRGTNGPNGNIVFAYSSESSYEPLVFPGGLGGYGGGSLITVSRGSGIGVGGEINLSGLDGSLGGTSGNYSAGSGGGGAPGCILFLIDGNLNNYPILSGKIVSEYGNYPIPSQTSGAFGKSTSTIDLGANNARVLYVPASRTPYPDYGQGEPPGGGGGSTTSHFFKQATEPTNTNAQTEVGRNLIKGDRWLNTNGKREYTYTGTLWAIDEVSTDWDDITEPKPDQDANNYTALWGTNIGNQPPDTDVLNSNQLWNLISSIPSNLDVLTGTESINNSTITISQDGYLVDSNGNVNLGTVTLGGLGAGDVATFDVLPNAYIQNVAADKLIAGTIGAYDIYLGNTNFHLDGTNRRMDIKDNASNLRVRVGYDGANYGFELYSGTGVKLLDADGDAILAATSQVEDGVNYRNLARGLQVATARDGDAVTFPLTWDQPPTVKFVGGGLSYSSSLTGDQFQHLQALNVSTTGFTVSAKLKELAGATTNRSDSSLITSGTYTWEIHKSDSLEAFDDTYTFKFSATVYSVYNSVDQFWEPGNLTIELYTNDGAGWVKRKTISLTGSFTGSSRNFTESHDINVDGLTNHAGREFAFHIAADNYGNSDVSNQRVEYTTASAPASTSATPSGAPDLQYIVLGG